MRTRSQTEIRPHGREPVVKQGASVVQDLRRHNVVNTPPSSPPQPQPPQQQQQPLSRGARSASISHILSPQHRKTDLSSEAAAVLQRRSTEITRFRVFSRVRPFIEEELCDLRDGVLRSVVEMSGNRTILLDPKEDWAPKAQFEFDASLWSIPASQKLQVTFQDAVHQEHETQLAVYNLVAKPSVPAAFEGFNSCILTYGQTGSGKTYTMMGKYNPTLVCGGEGEEGIIPRVCNDIFQLLEVRREQEQMKPLSERVHYRIEVNFVEIYLERVRDLLDPALKQKDQKMNEAKIRQDPTCGPYVEGVTKYEVENWSHCCQLLERGSQHRTTCATLVHQQSSRSHAIFQITIVMEEIVPPKDRYSLPATRTRAGRLNLVDLAGSERGGMTDYVKESAAINTSLLALRRVIDNLVERQNILLDQARQEITGTPTTSGERVVLPQVPFRDSVLTWLLSDSIGGNARTTMVATLSPLAKNYGDTLATLQWSSKARNLVTLVKMNDVQTVVTDGMSTKATELNQAVLIQRQNVDSLKDALQQKQAYAETLDKETRGIMRQIILEKAQLEQLARENAALVIQRSVRYAQARRQQTATVSQIEAVNRRLANERRSLETHTAALADVQRQVEENETLLCESQANGEEAVRRLAAQEETAEAFQQKSLDVRERYDMICGERGKSEAMCRQSIAVVAAALEKLRSETDAARTETKRTMDTIAIMVREAKKSEDPAWRASVDRAAAEMKDVTAKLDVVTKRRQELSFKRDTLRIQRNRLYPQQPPTTSK